MHIEIIQKQSPLWEDAITYTKNCSWNAGAYLSKMMTENVFKDWERVLIAMNEGRIIGYCTFVKEDCIPDCIYTPFIGFVFVEEVHRGNRISQKLINAALTYAKDVGFSSVYLCSEEKELYEKYGFKKRCNAKDHWGNEEQIFEIMI